MKFKVKKASDSHFKSSIEIKDLGDLLSFIETIGGEKIIISKIKDEDYEIEIYDDYIE